MAVQIIQNADHQMWLASHYEGIGASLVPVIAGQSKYGNIEKAWKQYVTKEFEEFSTEATDWGHAFEDGVAVLFSKKTGLEIIKNSVAEFQFINDMRPYTRCSPDRLYWIQPKEGSIKRNTRDWKQKGILECKTTVVDPEAPGNEWMQRCWYCQVQYQLLVSEMDEAYLACAVFGFERKFYIYHWKADKDFQKKLLKLTDKFWEDVETKTPPTPRTKEEVDTLFPLQTEGKKVEATEDLLDAYTELKNIKQMKKQYEERETELQEKLITAMQDAEALTFNGEDIVTYKAPKPSLRFNETLFKEEKPELYESYKTETQGGRRFLVKSKKSA